MAKAKKDTTPTTPDAGAKPKQAPAAKATAPKGVAKKQQSAAKAGGGKPSTATSAPLIDTNLAASAAAAMVANRAALSQAAGSAAKQESAGFRQLKESLAKPGAANLGGILGTGPMQQKKPQSHGPDRQIGRNQTFGADVNRASVPRRTGGG